MKRAHRNAGAEHGHSVFGRLKMLRWYENMRSVSPAHHNIHMISHPLPENRSPKTKRHGVSTCGRFMRHPEFDLAFEQAPRKLKTSPQVIALAKSRL